MDDDLICNLRKCRKRLSSCCWVTSCSHMFCDDDGSKAFNKAHVCPACEANLSGKFDIVRIDLSPSEQYKSMILAGQRPETIMEICTRALSFWSYQAYQERSYQEFVSTKAKEKINQLEHYYEQLIAKTQQEINSSKKELDDTKRRLNETTEKFQEKSRQHQKLQMMYDSLRRKTVNYSVYNSREQAADINRIKSAFDLTLGTLGSAAEYMSKSGHSASLVDLTRISSNPLLNSPAEREFVWKPMTTATTGAVDYHNEAHTPLATMENDVQNRFHIEAPGSGIKRRLNFKKK